MSILAEVLESAAVVDIEDINKKVPELKGTVEKYKNEVVTNIENVYVKYKNKSIKNDMLLNKALQAQQTLIALEEKAKFISSKDLAKTDVELNKKLIELDYVKFALKVVLNLQNIVKSLDEFDLEFSVHNYLRCAEIIKDLEDMLKAVPEDEYLEILDELKLTVQEKYYRLHNDLKNIFTDNIQVIDNEENKTMQIKIKKPNEDIKNAVRAMYYNTEEVYPLNCLAKGLWTDVFTSIVNYQVNINDTEDSNYVTLTVSIKNKEKKSNYQEVFENLKKVLKFLKENFCYDICDSVTTLEYIGEDIRDNLSEIIIKNCLRDTIPSNAEELKKYQVVIESTKELELALLDAKIFKKDTTSILEYAGNVDVLFINKKCEESLNTATEIMKKELHEMVEVGVPYDPHYPSGREVLDFPQCCISKNVPELVAFCENLLDKALRATPENCGRLFTTVTNILTKYRYFVPEYHKNYLASLPQQIALFYNNCRFFENVVTRWNMKYCAQLKPTLVACNFTGEAHQFPILGATMFTNYIDTQINQINEIMSGARLIDVGLTLDTLDPKTEKSVRQCLRQQELLRTVWHKVLPYQIYNENIGTIVDALCRNIITAVIHFEDISSAAADQLTDVIRLVTTRAPKLFGDPKEVAVFVLMWFKLNELSFVLGASLVDINDRWADGKGVLAVHFEGNELKRLVKALFQNTDRRAAVLANISEFVIRNKQGM